MRRLLPLLAVLIVLAPLTVSQAAPPRRYLLGLPWETPIVDGIEAQNRAHRRRKSLDAIVRDHTRRARRKQSVENLYLLARAYGLRFTDARTQAGKTQSAAERDRLEGQASRDLASAQSTYRDVLKADARCYFAYHDLGVLELQRKRRSRLRAFQQFDKALSVNARYVDAIRKLILLYVEAKQQKDAVAMLRRLLRLEPGDEIARMQLVVGLTQIHRHDEALHELTSLLNAKPRHAPYRDLQAQIYMKQGRYLEALRGFRDIARENPNVPTPFVGMLRCLKAMRDADPQSAPMFDDYIFALRGLQRLERDPKRRAQLDEDIRKIEAAQHQPPPSQRDPDKPLTTDEVLKILASAPKQEDRARAIYFFLSRKEPMSARVVKAIAAHLSATHEPAENVRALAVRAVAHAGGTAVAGMVRLALADSAAVVRGSALDAIGAIAARDDAVKRPLILVLGTVVRDRDRAVASAARQTILRLTETHLDLPEDASASRHEAAFVAWWRGPVGQDLIANGLDRYGSVPDRFPEDVFLAYLDSPSMLVGRAAYDALGRIEAQAGSARAAWLARRPRFAAEAWTPSGWDRLRTTLRGWARGRP